MHHCIPGSVSLLFMAASAWAIAIMLFFTKFSITVRIVTSAGFGAYGIAIAALACFIVYQHRCRRCGFSA